MSKIDVISEITKLALPILSSASMELVDVEYKREGRTMVLRLFLDKEGGITLDDCAWFSREFSELLDVEELIREHYRLEVSSPGLDRPLKKSSDFTRYAGNLVKIKTFELLPDDAGNKRKTFMGRLKGLDGDIVSIDLVEGQHAAIPLEKIAKANLEIEF